MYEYFIIQLRNILNIRQLDNERGPQIIVRPYELDIICIGRYLF